MNTSFFCSRTRAVRGALTTLLLSVGGINFLVPLTMRGGEADDIIAVYSSISPNYSRTILPDGSFKPETYAFGEGGRLTGSQRDNTIDPLRFTDIAHIIAPTLASKKYFPSKPDEPRNTQLLIMVYWGTTVGTDDTSSSAQYQLAQGIVPPPMAPRSPPPNGLGGTAMVSDPSASGRAGEGQVALAIQNERDSALQQSLTLTAIANAQRDRQNRENAMIIGYLPELQNMQAYQMTSLDLKRRDVLDAVEESRYYVVLMAYDFQSLLQNKQRKLLWETRFSIPQRHHDFSKDLAAMAQSASHFFGQNSDGVSNKPLHDGEVIVGKPKVVGFEPTDK